MTSSHADEPNRTIESPGVRPGLSLAVALLLFAGGELLLWRFIQGERQSDADLARFMAVQELATYRARIEGLLNANLVSIRTLRTDIALGPGIDTARFERIVSELLSDDLHTRHVALAPDLVIADVYPRVGNEAAIGVDYRDVEVQFASIRQALAADDVVINGPVELVQGGRALIGRVPVSERDSGRFWGVISVVIDHEKLFRDAGLMDTGRWRIGLRGFDGLGMAGGVIFGEARIWEGEPVTVPVELPAGEWLLAALPESGGWMPSPGAYRRQWAAGSGLSLALSLMFFGVLTSRNRLSHALSTIRHQARFDPLTELPNRRYFVYRLGRGIHRARRETGRLALLFIDLDHFKEINDSLGHDAGDELLQEVSRRITGAVRGTDLVGRFGGDEFVVMLRELEDPVDAERVAAKLLKSLRPLITVAGHGVTIDGSIGIAVYPEDGMTTGDLLKHADLAMYAAKSAGRGTSHFFNDSLRHQAESHLALHNEIKHGLGKDQFEVHYQPIVDASSRHLSCVEALLRWRHPQRGLVSPAQFIPVAERTGVIRELGHFVLGRACRDLQCMQRAGLDVDLSINRSSREFNDRAAIAEWLDVIDRHGVPRGRLIFEITESALMPDRDRQHRLLRRLNAEGIRLSIDDFGQGYSSVTYLKKFPVAQIKIDRAFVKDMEESERQSALVEALAKMARALQLEVVAEGVETASQAERLTALGVDKLQGYHFGRPMPLDDLLGVFGRSAPRRQ